MADETATNAQATEETPQAETDWQAKYEEMRGHMREWQKRAQANQGAADELEKLKAAQMTEQENAIAEKEAALAELAAFKAEKEQAEAAQRIAADSGVPVELLMFCQDEEAMTEFARTYGDKAHVSAAPNALGGSRIIRSDKEKRSNGDLFAEVAEQLFNN